MAQKGTNNRISKLFLDPRMSVLFASAISMVPICTLKNLTSSLLFALYHLQQCVKTNLSDISVPNTRTIATMSIHCMHDDAAVEGATQKLKHTHTSDTSVTIRGTISETKPLHWIPRLKPPVCMKHSVWA